MTPELAARAQVATALRSGRLTRNARCEVPGCPRTNVIDGHHEDYDRPLDVIWLCRFHHQVLHQSRRRGDPDPQWMRTIKEAA